MTELPAPNVYLFRTQVRPGVDPTIRWRAGKTSFRLEAGDARSAPRRQSWGGKLPFLSEAWRRKISNPTIDGVHRAFYLRFAPLNWACKWCGLRQIWLNAFAGSALG